MWSLIVWPTAAASGCASSIVQQSADQVARDHIDHHPGRTAEHADGAAVVLGGNAVGAAMETGGLHTESPNQGHKRLPEEGRADMSKVAT